MNITYLYLLLITSHVKVKIICKFASMSSCYIPNLSANYAVNLFTKHQSDNRIIHSFFALRLQSNNNNLM